MRWPLWRKLADRRRAAQERGAPAPADRVWLNLPGLVVAVERAALPSLPAELTVVVPRAEIRAHLSRPGGEQASLEVVLNSITVVHAPRHAPEAKVPTPGRGETRGASS